MPNLWDMTEEEIAQVGAPRGEAPPRGYMWGDPEGMRRERVQQSVADAVRRRNQGVRYQPPTRIHDAATGRVTERPGAWAREHIAPREDQGDRGISIRTRGGLSAMIEQGGGSKDVIEAAQQIEDMPGGMELLTSHAAEEMMKAQGIPKKQAKKIRLYEIGGYVEKAQGGAASAAERTRKAGRGDDSVLLHMTPEESEVLEAMWGAPDINPNTGMGEYGFLSKVWKKVKKGVKKVFKSKAFRIIAPIALSIFAPGIGTAIGMKLGLSGAAASIAGNAVVQGGLGAVTGGKEGAIKGAISGGLGAAAGAYGKGVGESLGLSGKTADVVGSAVVRGTGEQLTGGDFTSGAITGGLGAATRGQQEQMGRDVRRSLGFEADVPEGQLLAQREVTAPGAAPELVAQPTGEDILAGEAPYDPTTGKFEAPPTPAPAAAEAPLSLPELAAKYALPVGMSALGAMGASQGYEDEPPPWWGRQGDTTFGENLPVYTMNRRFRGLPGQADYFTYGQPGSPQSGQHLFMAPQPFAGEQGTPTAPPTGLAAVVQAEKLRRRSQGRSEPLRGRTGSTEFVAQGGYQRGGEFNYWEQNADVPNAVPTVSREGGHKVKGPGNGRSDDIPAMLSDGEYVIDAETVALLGDGSGDAGARRLDEMRQELRKHKAKNLGKGEFTHKAKKPANYMRNVRKLRRKAKYEHGGTTNVAGTSPLSPTQAAGRNI